MTLLNPAAVKLTEQAMLESLEAMPKPAGFDDDVRLQPHTSPWTHELTDQLRTMWAEGKTSGQIAIKLGTGFTRNAVIGKVHRLKLQTRVYPPKPIEEAKPIRKTVGRAFIPRLPLPVQKAKPIPLPALCVPVGLQDRTGCCFPVVRTTEHLFCNATCSGDYCDYHRRVMYVRPE
jgi:hypothetical protein